MKRSNPLLGALLTPRALRVLSAATLTSALAMPWLAWWGGAFGEAREVSLPERVVAYRPALVALPGGTFMMGTSRSERLLLYGEFFNASNELEVAAENLPSEVQHAAEVGGFDLCRTEVTQGQWKAVMGLTALGPGECGREDCEDSKPITDVTWFEAVEYMNRLTERENLQRGAGEQLSPCYVFTSLEEVRWDRDCTGYRLPTEAEWEYAARAGSGAAYSFGDDPIELCEHGNVADITGKAEHTDWAAVACDDGAADLAGVGSYEANPWGLYDVHGNVWEWVWDWHADYEDEPPRNYAGPEKGTARALRGGSFGSGPRILHSSTRFSYAPALTSAAVGLRCARGPHPETKLVPGFTLGRQERAKAP